MNFNESIEELGCRELWRGFISEVYKPVDNPDKPNLQADFARIHVSTLLGHAGVMLSYYGRALESHMDEMKWVRARLELQREIGEALLKEHMQLGRPNGHGVVESREYARQRIGKLQGLLEAAKVSEDCQARLKRRSEALDAFKTALEGAEDVLKKRCVGICESYSLKEELEALGAQLGPGYFHKKGQAYYSGPQNPPQRPTASPVIPGHAEEPGTEECYCVWCRQYVAKPKSERGDLSHCEEFAHVCRDGELRMLTTCTKMGGDKREPFDADKDRPLKQEPHT